MLSLYAPVSLFAFGFICALFFHGTDSSLYAPALLGLIGGCGALLITNFKNGLTVPKIPITALLLVWWIYLLLSLTWSSVPFISTFFTLIFSTVPVLFFTLTGTTNSEQTIRHHVLAAGAILALLAFWAVIQFFFLHETYGPRIKHPLLNPNNLAALINMGLLPAVAAFLLLKEKRHIIAAGALTVLFSAALLTTHSRGGILAALAALVPLLLLTVPPAKNKIPKLSFLLGSTAVLSALFQFRSSFSSKQSFIEITTGGSFIHGVTDRLSLWEATLGMIADKPWMGTGLGTFSYYYAARRLPDDQSDGFFAHMDPLQFGAEMGVIAPLIFYALLTAILIRTISALRASWDNPDHRAMIAAPFCTLLAVLLHTHISFHLYLLPILIPAGVLLSAWYVATEKALPSAHLPASFSKPVSTAFLIVLALAGFWTLRTGIGIHYMKQANQASVRGKIEAVRQNIDIVSRFAPASYFRAPQYEARWRTARLFKEGRAMPEGERRQLYKEAQTYLDEAQSLHGQFAYVRAERAKLYEVGHMLRLEDDALDKAVASYHAALEIDPIFLAARMELARLYRQKGELRQALAILEDGLPRPRRRGQSDIDYLVTTARLKLQLGDQEGHDFLIQEAARRAKRYGLMWRRK